MPLDFWHNKDDSVVIVSRLDIKQPAPYSTRAGVSGFPEEGHGLIFTVAEPCLREHQ